MIIIISSVILAVQPLIVKSVTAALEVTANVIMQDVREDMDKKEKVQRERENNSLTNLKKEVQTQNFELDKLEQYSRKENIKVFGLDEREGEDTNEMIVKLASDIGIQISQSDISVSHRLPGPRGKPRPIIAKFVRRDTKSLIMKNKKNLNSNPQYKQVYINDDFTQLRGKLIRAMKDDDKILKVWTIDGKIFCIVKEDGREVKKVIDSADNLLAIGWDEQKIKEVGIYLQL